MPDAEKKPAATRRRRPKSETTEKPERERTEGSTIRLPRTRVGGVVHIFTREHR